MSKQAPDALAMILLRRIDECVRRLDRDVSRQHGGISVRLGAVEDRMGALEARLIALEDWTSDVTQRLARIERLQHPEH